MLTYADIVLTYADIAHSQLSRMQRDMCEKETYLRMQRLEMSEKDTAVRQLQREVSSAYVCQQYVSIRMSAVCQHTYVSSISAYS
jgi:hypothetical protein